MRRALRGGPECCPAGNPKQLNERWAPYQRGMLIPLHLNIIRYSEVLRAVRPNRDAGGLQNCSLHHSGDWRHQVALDELDHSSLR